MNGYAWNIALTGVLMDPAGKSVPVRESLLPYPATTVLACDEASGVFLTAGPDPHKYGGHRPEDEERGWQRHSGGANYAFCDQHSKWYREEAVGYNSTDFPNKGTQPTFALSDRFYP